MVHADNSGGGRRNRRRRAVSEKIAIVRLTMEPCACVAEIARAHGVNANQLFKWRRLFEKGQLGNRSGRSIALLPIAISAEIQAMR
jgi:transposase